MKKIIRGCIIGVLLLTTIDKAKAQSDTADKQAIQMLTDFYTAYNTAWSTGSGPDIIPKTEALRKKYCTVKLYNTLENEPMDHDRLIADKVTDVEHLKTLTIAKDPAKADAYIVKYRAYHKNGVNPLINASVVIHVTVAKEGTDFKIAAVK